MTKKFYIFENENLKRPVVKNISNISDEHRIYVYEESPTRPLAVPKLGDINKNNFYSYYVEEGKVSFDSIANMLEEVDVTPTPSISESATPTPTPSVTSTITPTPTPSVTSSITPTPTPTSSVTPTPTPTPTSSSVNNPDLSTASYDSVSFGVGAQDGVPRGIAFSPDGGKMYMIGSDTDTVYQYALAVAWDLSTASYVSVSFSISAQDTAPLSLAFSSDGTKMYMIGDDTNTAYQYTLSAGWNLSTASYDNVSFSIGGQDSAPYDIAFSSDGTKMYMLGLGTDTVYQYTLSTAWDLSTASYDSVSFGVAAQDGQPLGLAFSADGTKMYMLGNGTDIAYQYTLSTAWDLSTASYDSVSFGVGAQDGTPVSLAFSSDGTKMYMVGLNTDTIYQYSV